MNTYIDNEKLTAYILGELEPVEHAEIARQMAEAPELQALLDEINNAIQITTACFKAEPVLELGEERKHAIQKAGQRKQRPTKVQTIFRYLVYTAGTAIAVLLIAALIGPHYGARLKLARPDSQGTTTIEQGPPRKIASKIDNDGDGLRTNYYADVQIGEHLLGDPGSSGGQAQQRTRLNIKAEFTDNVDAYIVLPDTFQGTQNNLWAEDFDTNHVYAHNGLWGYNTEAYNRIVENPFLGVAQNPLSTFSIDVDTASYANLRRFLTRNTLPPPDAVRIEEMLNYFPYDYSPPQAKETPFAAHIALTECPWKPEHRLARIAIKGWEIPPSERTVSNLVFLVDVSGSMGSENKLPLVQKSLRMLVQQLDERDRVAMAVYAGSSGLVLSPTPGNQKEKILAAIDRLESGGSTHGSAGIQLAYETAVSSFIRNGVNRVILCTDGDFNVGLTDQGQLTRLIEDKAKSGVFLSVLGFGMGNLKDNTMELLADKGNGNYAYIDTENEARKVLVDQMQGTLVTIAKDVKIQVEFNPAKVAAYRLIGYENRMLRAEDFNDDKKDAGEIGAGHAVTALYELVPAGQAGSEPGVDPLKYQQTPATPAPVTAAPAGNEVFTLKIRYKQPDGDVSSKLEFPTADDGASFAQADPDFKFAAAVAEFGMLLRHSQYAGNATFAGILELAETGRGSDPHGYRAEFINLVRTADRLSAQ